MTQWHNTSGPPSVGDSVANVVSNVHSGVAGVADGIHQSVHGDSATGTSQSAAAVRANLTSIPPDNVSAQSYAAVGISNLSLNIPPNQTVFIPPNKIDHVAVSGGPSVGASKSKGLWIAETGIYNIEVFATFKASAGALATNCSFIPAVVYGDTVPPSSGSWSSTHTMPMGSSATCVDSGVLYSIGGNNTYSRTDSGTRYFLPGVICGKSGSGNATFNLNALAMVIIKIST